MDTHDLSRRDFLKAAGVTAGALAATALLPRAAEADQKPSGYKTKHVIFIALAGGVRAKEYLGMANNAPNIHKIIQQGCVIPATQVANLGHYAAALSMFTGVPENMGIRENQRGDYPTIFEYLRKQKGLPGKEVWLSASGGAQQLNIAYSLDSDHGQQYGANLVSSDGIFNAEFKEVVDAFGRPELPNDDDAKTLSEIRAAMDAELATRVKDGNAMNDAETARKVESFILSEISKNTTRLTGPGAEDVKTLRVGMNIMRIFRPTFMGFMLTNADVAHGSYNAYVEVVRRNDDEIGAIWRAVQADPELKDSTTIMICPEFGRDKDLNQRNGLDHGDGSNDLNHVAMVAAGPDFKKNQVIQNAWRSYDACATIGQLLGVKPERSKGKAIKDLFA